MNIGFICLVPVIMMIVAIPIWTRDRSKTLINAWTVDQGFQIINAQQRLFQRGPFSNYDENATVWVVTLRDYQGMQQQGWLLCVLPLMGGAGTRVEYRSMID